MQALFPGAGVVHGIKLFGAPPAKRVWKITSDPCMPNAETHRRIHEWKFPGCRGSAGPGYDRSR